jgi:hypothetical protein
MGSSRTKRRYEMSEDQTNTASRRKRGTGFASVPLGEAISAVKDAGKYGREHGLEDFAGYLGHSTTNSGPFRRKMAALKDWGLIERNGERVVFTDLANEIAYPLSSEQEAARIRDAFRNESLFANIYDESTKDTELDLEFIGGRAVNGFGVAPQSLRQFAASFGGSVETARLGKMTGNGKIVLRDPSVTEDAENADGESAADLTEVDTSSPQGRRKLTPRISPVLQQIWDLEPGAVIFDIQLDRALPASAFTEVSAVVSAIEKLVKILKPAGADEGAAE